MTKITVVNDIMELSNYQTAVVQFDRLHILFLQQYKLSFCFQHVLCCISHQVITPHSCCDVTGLFVWDNLLTALMFAVIISQSQALVSLAQAVVPEATKLWNIELSLLQILFHLFHPTKWSISYLSFTQSCHVILRIWVDIFSGINWICCLLCTYSPLDGSECTHKSTRIQQLVRPSQWQYIITCALRSFYLIWNDTFWR